VARQDVKDEVIYLRAAGLDLGKRFLVACVRTPAASRAGTWSLETERFETTAAEIRRLLAWLLERRVEVVVLEATSDYWRHLYYTLQPQLNLMLVNPAHLKGIRGRKSDPSDAAFLARAGASGMVMGSFVPRREIRELRDLTRCRTEVITARGREAQRLEKELEDTGMKLSSVISDITGATGRAIINALIQGERDPGTLADLAVRRARSKIPALIEALEGTFTEHHASMCRHYLDELDHLTAVVEHLDARIAALLARLSRDQDVDRLDTIPGIGRAAAQIIIAETGGDMAQFATAGHLARPRRRRDVREPQQGHLSQHVLPAHRFAPRQPTGPGRGHAQARHRDLARPARQDRLPRPGSRLLHPPRPRTRDAPHDQGSQPPRPDHPLRTHRGDLTCTKPLFSCQSQAETWACLALSPYLSLSAQPRRERLPRCAGPQHDELLTISNAERLQTTTTLLP